MAWEWLHASDLALVIDIVERDTELLSDSLAVALELLAHDLDGNHALNDLLSADIVFLNERALVKELNVLSGHVHAIVFFLHDTTLIIVVVIIVMIVVVMIITVVLHVLEEGLAVNATLLTVLSTEFDHAHFVVRAGVEALEFLAVFDLVHEFIFAVVILFALVSLTFVIIIILWDVELLGKILAGTFEYFTVNLNSGIAMKFLLSAWVEGGIVCALSHTIDVVSDVVHAVITHVFDLALIIIILEAELLLEIVTVARNGLTHDLELSIAPGLDAGAVVNFNLVVALGNSWNLVLDIFHAVAFLEHIFTLWQVEVSFGLVAISEFVFLLADDNMDGALFAVLIAGVEGNSVVAGVDIVEVWSKVFLAGSLLLNVNALSAHDSLEGFAIHSVHVILLSCPEVNVALILEGTVVEAAVDFAVLKAKRLISAVSLFADVAVIIFHFDIEEVHEIIAIHALLAIGSNEINEASTLHGAWLKAGGNLAVLHVHVLSAVVVDLALHLAMFLVVVELLAINIVQLAITHEGNHA